MSTPSGDRHASPFIFATETDFRFLTLALVVIGAAIFAFDNLYLSLAEDITHQRALAAQCRALASGPATPADIQQTLSDPFGQPSDSQFLKCRAEWRLRRAPFMAFGAFAVLGTATVIYLIWPRLRIARQRLEVLVAQEPLQAQLESVVSALGLAKSPTFVWDPSVRPEAWVPVRWPARCQGCIGKCRRFAHGSTERTRRGVRKAIDTSRSIVVRAREGCQCLDTSRSILGSSSDCF